MPGQMYLKFCPFWRFEVWYVFDYIVCTLCIYLSEKQLYKNLVALYVGQLL